MSDDKIILNLEKERFTRIRHDYGMTRDFVLHCCNAVSIDPKEIDVLVLQRGSEEAAKKAPGPPLFKGSPSFGYRTKTPFFGRSVETVHIHHHLAHVASAYFTSPFQESALLSWDGMGDNFNTSIGLARNGRIVWWMPFVSANIATWFQTIGLNNFGMKKTSDFDVGSQAGKLMALAAYGEEDPELIRHLEGEIALFHRLFLDRDGQTSTRPGYNLSEDLTDSYAPRAQALARAIQVLAERYMDQLFDRTYELTGGPDNICYSGGVALNCVANTKAMNGSRFSNLYVPPCSNDGGLALGQALLTYYQVYNNPFVPSHFSPYRGPAYTPARIAQAIAAADIGAKGINVRSVGIDEMLDLLVGGHIVALFRGGSEAGPRALGHRSFVSRPDTPGLRDRLNDEVKQREWYRPFAPIVLADWSDRVFETPFPHSPFMATTATIRPEWRERMAAVCHVDHTTRPQVLERDHEPWLHELLSRFCEVTGIPAIVNTSFNRREPIVETPEEAIRTYLETPIRYLYLDGTLLEKPADRD